VTGKLRHDHRRHIVFIIIINIHTHTYTQYYINVHARLPARRESYFVARILNICVSVHNSERRAIVYQQLCRDHRTQTVLLK